MATRFRGDQRRVLERYEPPVSQIEEGFSQELQILLDILPPPVAEAVWRSAAAEGIEGNRLDGLSEIYLQLGRQPEAIFQDERGTKKRVRLAEGLCELSDLNLFAVFRETDIGISKRIGIPRTLHRCEIWSPSPPETRPFPPPCPAPSSFLRPPQPFPLFTAVSPLSRPRLSCLVLSCLV